MSKAFADRSQQNNSEYGSSDSTNKNNDPIAQLKWIENALKAPGWNTNNIQPAQLTAEEHKDLMAQRQKEFSKHTFNVPMQMFAREEELNEKNKNKEDELQMKPDEGQGMKNDTTASSSSSTSLPDGVKARMESSFNTDFSAVRVHSNSEKATQIGALAYTQGTDIHFAPGQYNPNSQKGQELLGHELTHVVQQRQGRVHPTMETGGIPINDSAALEKEADTIGGKAAQGKMDDGNIEKTETVDNISNNEFQEGDPPANGKYIIKERDTFEILEKRWNLPFGALKKCNPGVDPYKLQINQTINTPYRRGGLLIYPEGEDVETKGSKSEKIANELIKRNKGKANGFGEDFKYTDEEESILFRENGEFTDLGICVNEIIKEQGYLQKRNKEAADFFSGLINSGILTNSELSELTAIRAKVKSETMAKYLAAIYSPDIVGTILFMSLGAQGSANLQSKAASFSPKFAQSTAKVWSSINSTGANVAGTQIPKAFVLNGKYWVHPNATKHMVEYVVRIGNPATAPLRSQLTLSSFKSAVDQLTRQAIKMNKMYTSGNWEIMFSKSAKDVLPVIKHARMIL